MTEYGYKIITVNGDIFFNISDVDMEEIKKTGYIYYIYDKIKFLDDDVSANFLKRGSLSIVYVPKNDRYFLIKDVDQQGWGGFDASYELDYLILTVDN